MTDAALVNSPEFTVSELSASLKRTLEDAFGHVRVRGELGKVSYHSNGHVYFDLKDDRAVIAGVIWRSAAARIRLRLEAGLEVIATGRITTFPGRSQYQLIVDSVEPAGLGALMALVEQRKAALAAEGLFDPARKQLLPFLPSVIGVITSPTGAVIRDILHRLADRFPRRVLVWPVRVQGEGSAAEVARAIEGFNALPESGPLPRPDVIIVARGGGSLEDLWSFNEEIVVRAAAASLVPLISAVGHETDVTLIDFAADLRAPTPTAAAEMVVPVRADLILQVDGLGRRAMACWVQGLQRRRSELRGLTRALPGADRVFGERRQRLDIAGQRLLRGLSVNAAKHRQRLDRCRHRLDAYSPQRQIPRLNRSFASLEARLEGMRPRLLLRKRERLLAASTRLAVALRAARDAHRNRLGRDAERLAALHGRLGAAMAASVARRRQAAGHAESLLRAFSYRGVLERGFALVRDGEGRPLRQAANVTPGARLAIEFADGRVAATADGGAPHAGPGPLAAPAAAPAADPAASAAGERPAAAARAWRGRRGGPGGGGVSGQGSLFDR